MVQQMVENPQHGTAYCVTLQIANGLIQGCSMGIAAKPQPAAAVLLERLGTP
jgi:hypothetical protein